MSSTESKYRIIIADDHDILRFGLKNLIIKDPSLEVVAEAQDGQTLLDLLEKKKCDLVILDLSMPGLDGLKALDRIRARHGDLQILILTMHKEREFFRHALARGVQGYMLKDDSFDRILFAIHEIRAGRKSYSAEIASFIVEDYNLIRDSQMSQEILTRREKEILKMIAGGMTNREIGKSLEISPRTIQTHRTNIMQKLDLKNTAEMVKFAIERGLA